MRYRTLGRTGLQISEIGFGGAPAGLRNYLGIWDPDQEQAERSITGALAEAVRLGINYFDTAPAYGEGASERLFGKGLRPFRDRVFIATKLAAAGEDAVRRSVEASLERLQTGTIDVLQLHGGWYREEEVDRILGPGGALAGMQAAQAEGLVRFIGFTTEGANGPASRLVASGAFDILQICYNLIYQHPFDPSRKAGLLYEAEGRGMGIVTMRPLTSGIFQRWLGQVFPHEMENPAKQDRVNAALLAFVLSNPLVDAALVGMRTAQEARRNVEIVEDAALRIDLDWLHERYKR
jgi:aryl-alcohol dehydrogenase-like predicted oxidoreductase